MDGFDNHFRLALGDNPAHVKSLKELCRCTILKNTCASLKHIARVGKLPLPTIVKEFVTTFCIPEHFDLNGTFMDYNFNFPYHLQHKTHQVCPAVYQLDGSQVLIKVFRDWQSRTTHFGACAMCGTDSVKNSTSSLKELEKWRSLDHKNLMNCLVSFSDDSAGIMCYVLEFPLMNIHTYVYQLFLSGRQLPEHLAWETLVKLTSVFLFLESRGVVAWDFCIPDHIVIDHHGEVKLENMLLYLPNAHKLIPDPPQISSHLMAPEIRFGGMAVPMTTVWGVGSIIRELIAPIPSVVKYGNLKYAIPISNKMSTKYYSTGLKNVVANCTIADPRQRPSLSKLNYIAKKCLSEINVQRGPTNLLQCLNQ
ncbi:hypothetical protein SNE40_010029 [Patella caerulea]|uniref:Protein kinase domain-containing protein n=1 Tax=Patella caerulea TaxID=87958 RepID=A0AAN8JSI1_PATCE